jgi:hypothetical protein
MVVGVGGMGDEFRDMESVEFERIHPSIVAHVLHRLQHTSKVVERRVQQDSGSVKGILASRGFQQQVKHPGPGVSHVEVGIG